MNRRDFVKFGLGGGGLAAGGGFVLRNEQKPSATFSKKFGHPWWVKEIDKPKLAVDDNSYTRFNSMNNVFGSMSKYYGMEKLKELRKRSREKTAQYFQEERPGFRLEDRALSDAAWVISRLGGLNRGTRAWTSKNVTTPEERGVEKYSASPEEAARVIKAAARYRMESWSYPINVSTLLPLVSRCLWIILPVHLPQSAKPAPLWGTVVVNSWWQAWRILFGD